MASPIPVSPLIYGGRKDPAADNMGVRNGIHNFLTRPACPSRDG